MARLIGDAPASWARWTRGGTGRSLLGPNGHRIVDNARIRDVAERRRLIASPSSWRLTPGHATHAPHPSMNINLQVLPKREWVCVAHKQACALATSQGRQMREGSQTQTPDDSNTGGSDTADAQKDTPPPRAQHPRGVGSKRRRREGYGCCYGWGRRPHGGCADRRRLKRRLESPRAGRRRAAREWCGSSWLPCHGEGAAPMLARVPRAADRDSFVWPRRLSHQVHVYARGHR